MDTTTDAELVARCLKVQSEMNQWAHVIASAAADGQAPDKHWVNRWREKHAEWNDLLGAMDGGTAAGLV